MLLGTLDFLSNGTEFVGEGLDTRRRCPGLAADAMVDLQGPEADASAPLHGGFLDRPQDRPRGAALALNLPLRRGGGGGWDPRVRGDDVEGPEADAPAPRRRRGLLDRLQTLRGAPLLLLLDRKSVV